MGIACFRRLFIKAVASKNDLTFSQPVFGMFSVAKN